MLNSLAARSPLRISFAGGGTDVEPFSKVHGTAIVSASINLYAEVSLSRNASDHIGIHSIDTGDRLELTAWNDEELKSHIVSACGLILPPSERVGLEVSFTSPVSPGSGLGASSALVVAMTLALAKFGEIELSKNELAQQALEIERNQMGIAGGFQDQYATAYGGLNFIESINGNISVSPLSPSDDFILELESNLILANLSLPRQGQHIIEDQQKNYVSGQAKATEAMKNQLEIGYEMREAFLAEDLKLIGQLMNRSWESKRNFSERVSTPRIDQIMNGLKEIPVYGAKITGAGGGGHLLILCHRSQRQLVKNFLKQNELPIRDFSFTNVGAVSWKI